MPSWQRLSNQISHLRLASTASHETKAHRYPYPTHPRPTPHQIFHLPPNASQKLIKQRYYELVRVHHPDSIQNPSLSPAERHARFQAITAAYDVLRGRSPSDIDPYQEEVLRRKRASHERRAEYMHPGRDWTASPDDRWKDRLIVLVGLLTLVAGIIPGIFLFPTRDQPRMAREHGEERNDTRPRQQSHDTSGSGESYKLKEPDDGE